MCPIMTKNENGLDRIIRVSLGAVLLAVARFLLTGVPQMTFYVLGAVALLTGITGFCALYKVLGISTLKKTN